MRYPVLGTEEARPRVHRHEKIPLCHRELRYPSGALRSRVIEDNVDAMAVLVSFFHECTHRVGASDIGVNETRCGACCDYLLCRLTTLLIVDVADHNLRALVGKACRSHPPDTRGRARDHGFLAFQPHVHTSFPD